MLSFKCSTRTFRREIHTAVVTSREMIGLGNEFRMLFVVFLQFFRIVFYMKCVCLCVCVYIVLVMRNCGSM
jgi:hypothetical protein